jgi:hypothetical protein
MLYSFPPSSRTNTPRSPSHFLPLYQQMFQFAYGESARNIQFYLLMSVQRYPHSKYFNIITTTSLVQETSAMVPWAVHLLAALFGVTDSHFHGGYSYEQPLVPSTERENISTHANQVTMESDQ